MHAWEAIQNSLDYIEDNLSAEITIQILAGVAGLSPYYFQRLFGRLAKKPVNEYIKLRRLAEAARELNDSQKRIADIALEFGFSDHASFTRAFTEAYGITPKEYREHPVFLNHYNKPDLALHVLSIRTKIHFDDFPKTADAAFQKIQAYAMQNTLLFSGCPFVCYHNTDLTNLDVEIGFPVVKPVSGNGEIIGRTIPARKAVSGIFLGAYEETDPLMMEIFRWIAEHGYEQTGTIYNHYLNDADRPAAELLTQIVIPVN